jgi:hypothetical protein
MPDGDDVPGRTSGLNFVVKQFVFMRSLVWISDGINVIFIKGSLRVLWSIRINTGRQSLKMGHDTERH